MHSKFDSRGRETYKLPDTVELPVISFIDIIANDDEG